MNKLKYKFAAFMAGRNGVDQLGKFLLICSIVLMLLSSILPWQAPKALLYYGSLALIIYMYVRMMSRNLYKRQAENDAFLRKLSLRKTKNAQRKDYKFFTCPNCKTTLRVPRGKGKISITCKNCGTKFIGKS